MGVVETGWTVREEAFVPARLHHKETVFTLGNGYLSTRGAFEEGYPLAWAATLVHGAYDSVPISYTELANCPDWLPLHISVDGSRFRLDRGHVLSYQRQLDLWRGILSRRVRWRSPAGQTLDIRFERFAALHDPHVLALRCEITPIDSSCTIKVQAGIDGYANNQGVAHWEWVDQGVADGAVWLQARTRHSGIDLGMASRLEVTGADNVHVVTADCRNAPAVVASLDAQPAQTVRFEKTVTVYTSREADQPASAAREKLSLVSDYARLAAAQEHAWAQVWATSDVLIEGDPRAQLAIRYSLFQLLIAAPQEDDRVSIPAKTLSGFGYRGHVFWDTEIFVLPFLSFTRPTAARNLLTYRYHTLPGARRKAREAGYEGAMYAWESAATGDEVTPRWVPGPKGKELVRIWCGDIELHITCDVAYAVWNYWRVTGDDEWMLRYGAEIVLDTAVFWGSRVEWNAERDQYEISDVIGPDEYHEHVDNSVFTNRMVQWHLRIAAEVYDWLSHSHPDRASDLAGRLRLTAERLAHWSHISERIVVLYDPETGLMEQSEGFFALQDLDLTAFEPRERSMQTILGIEGANAHQVLKQADVLMLLYLLRDHYDLKVLRANWDYYAPRTDHTYGSSLGPAIHAIAACALEKSEEAYEHFIRAALVDLEDVRGNAADGIHAASAGGLWQAIVFGFGGVRLTPNGPIASPRLPARWTRLRFKIQHHGTWYELDLTGSRQRIAGTALPSAHSECVVPGIRGLIFDLDGVLTDTSEYHYLAWKRLADEEGIPFDRQANEALRGVSRRTSLMVLLGDRSATEEQIQEMMARKNRYYQELIQGIGPENLLPGASELLVELREAGLKVAVGSASRNANSVIEKLCISGWLDAVSDGHSVERQKPAPDLFLHAAAQLGLDPDQCVVIEDAASGVEAALAAGMWTVGLGPASRVGAAHVVIPSLDGVGWVHLRSLLAQSLA
jgi:kojibiose phosphorylase